MAVLTFLKYSEGINIGVSYNEFDPHFFVGQFFDSAATCPFYVRIDEIPADCRSIRRPKTGQFIAGFIQ
jgi:hypothetical protein